MTEMIASLVHAIKAAWAWGGRNFDGIAGWASIAGFIISLVIMLRVRSLQAALFENALKRAQRRLFENVRASLVGKPRLTISHERDLKSLLGQVQGKDCSWLRFRTLGVRRKIKEIRKDVADKTTPDLIIVKLDELRILIRNTSADE